MPIRVKIVSKGVRKKDTLSFKAKREEILRGKPPPYYARAKSYGALGTPEAMRKK